MNKIQNKKAFTLVELLIVITIIGILFVVLISRVDFARDKAKTTGVNTDFREYELAFQTAAGNGQGFDPLYVFTPEVITHEQTDAAGQGTMVKEAASAADNLLAAINSQLDDAMRLKLAYGYSAHDSDGKYVGANDANRAQGAAVYASQLKNSGLTLIDLGMTLDYKDSKESGCGVAAVFVTEKLDPWNEQYIVYYVQGQMETVHIGATGSNDEYTVIRNVADGTIHGNRGTLCMISKGVDVDEMLVWDDRAIDDTYDETVCFQWDNGQVALKDTEAKTEGGILQPGKTHIKDIATCLYEDGDAPDATWTTGAKKYDATTGSTNPALNGKFLCSGSFVPAEGSDDLVLTVSYSFASGRGVATIKTFGFGSNID